MTEPTKPSFWSELFTAPRIISFVVMLTGGAMWVQAFRSEVAALRTEVAAIKTEYQRSDTLRYELAAIRDEQQRIRQQLDRQGVQQDKMAETVQALRRDLR